MSRGVAGMLGLLKIKIKRGINLAVRDALTSDPYIVLTMGRQKVKTRVIKSNCNPVWNEYLTLPVYDTKNIQINLTVFDKDTFSVDDKMGEADLDVNPYLECINMTLDSLPNGCAVKKIQPTEENCLSDESQIVWNNGKMVQNMIIKLKNVECGEVELQIEWSEIKV